MKIKQEDINGTLVVPNGSTEVRICMSIVDSIEVCESMFWTISGHNSYVFDDGEISLIYLDGVAHFYSR